LEGQAGSRPAWGKDIRGKPGRREARRARIWLEENGHPLPLKEKSRERDTEEENTYEKETRGSSIQGRKQRKTKRGPGGEKRGEVQGLRQRRKKKEERGENTRDVIRMRT